MRKYGKDDESADDSGNNAAAVEAAAKAALTDAELRLGRLIWSHIVGTGDVSVGVGGKWNHLTFEELVSLPEEKAEGSGAPIKDIRAMLNDEQLEQSGNAISERPSKPRKLPKIRPRLFVGQETVWKTLTGHGIDFKRIPPLEWKLVAYIGSTKEVGISQPDLVRATGQDKRSVPRRTDFLSYKGYIVKRTHMVRGMKTSKLWLTKFAPDLPSPTDPLKGLDMSKDILTRDMEPVPWVHQWVGNKTVKGKEELAYTALVQTIVAVIKAWGTLRLRDLKLKLGVMGLKWQMKIVSKFLRRANERGNLAYTAAQFAGNNVIFKDCIKFVREPTEDDWRILLATGVRSRPSYNKRTGKKMKKKAKGKARGRPNLKPNQMARILKKRFRHPPSPAVAQWTPEKPFANTLAEYVLTGGREGYTTTEVSHALVGPEFYRYMHKYMSNMCKSDNQPPRLSEYDMSSELTRSGSVQAYVFSCAGAAPTDASEDLQGELAIDPALAQESIESTDDSAAFGFGPVDPNTFIKNGPADLASLVQILPAKKAIKPKRAYNRRKGEDADMAADENSPQPAEPKRGRPRKPREEPADEIIVDSAAASSGRRGRKRKAAQRVSYVDDLDRLIDGSVTSSDGESRPKRTATEQAQLTEPLDAATEQSGAESVKSIKSMQTGESEKTPDRSLPGVYYGIPGSLNPNPHKKGRPRKSIVLIFKSGRFKDPNFLPGWSNYPPPQDEATPPPRKPAPSCKVEAPTPTDPASEQVSVSIPTQPEIPTALSAPSQNADSVTVVQPLVVAAQQEQNDSIVVKGNNTKTTSQAAGGLAHTVLLPPSDTSSTPIEKSSEPLSAATNKTETVAAPKTVQKKKQLIKPNEAGMYVCEKCNGSWANDNGLQYHLTKGKNLCNPFYAENPDAMQRNRRIQKGRYASSESATPGTPASSAANEPSNASEAELSPAPARRSKEKKRKPPAKTHDRSASTLLESAEPTSPAKPRPVLKPRSSILKNRRLGGSGIIPRGVEASEAAAKRNAAEQEAEEIAATPVSVANDTAVGVQNGAAAQEEYWEPEEDLPYLKHIQLPTAGSSQPKSPEEASQTSSGHNHDHQMAEEQQVGPYEVDSAYPYPPVTNEVAGVSDPYPADLLDPALRATDNGDVVTTPSMNQTATARRGLPGTRPPPSTVTRNVAATEASREGGSVQRPPPSVQMPTSRYAGKKDKPLSLLSERQILPYRIQEIIQYLIASNGGVFPKDRKTLHWAVLKVFKATFSSPNGILPTQVGTVRGVGTLERDKIIKTGSVAIQPEGHWKQYDIVYFPKIQIKTDPVVSHLKAQAEAAHPEMYIPFPFSPTEDEKIYFSSLDRPSKNRGQGPGRRDHKLDSEIATLNAPFYKEKGLAGVRPRFRRARLESESEDEGRSKKRRRYGNSDLTIKRKKKLADDGDDGDEGHVVKRKRGRKRRNYDDEYIILEPSKLSIDGSRTTNPGISSLPASFFSRTAVPELDFLAPNTQLEDDYVPSTPSEYSVPEDEDEGDAPPKVPIGTCAQTTEIHANGRGVWPNIPNTWFEKTSGSFTMKGWMPTQSERLIEHLPKTSAEMAFRITSHCKTEQWTDPAFGVFLTSVDGCKAWELSDVGKHFMSGSIAPNYVFMNFSSTKEVSNMAPIDIQWSEENEWTLQTIPYDQLEDHDDDPYLQYDISVMKSPKRARGRPPKPKSEAIRKYQKRIPRDPTVREIKVQRELNAYPTTKSDYFRSKGEESLGIDWKAEDTRIAAYVAVSTLTGGINKAMDWGLMMRLFPEAKLSNLRKFWSMIKKEREGFIHSLSAKFQDEFLIAYEKGEHGSFDFDDPLNYDWLKLVKWTLALVVRESIELPPNRIKFEDELELIQVDKNEFDWRETYHHWQRSVFNRFQDSTSEAASTALEITPEVVDNYKIIARSWFRALCCTDPEQYSPYEIRDKFKGLVRGGHLTEQEVSDLLEATIFDLEHRRIAIKAKSKALTTGRPYRLNEHFSRTLDRYANEVKFSVAADFKLKLDQAFKKGETVEIPWRTEDGMILAAFNLQAAGRIRIEPRNRPSIPFGFKPGFYESRKFPKSYYRFDLHAVPTDRYVYNEDIEVLQDATRPDNIPAATEDGKLPMWCDFFGTPDRARWFKMLAGVFFAYATRGAMTDDFTTQALKPCFEQFEIEVVRKWGLKNGLLRELTVPGGAVTVTEWWWLVLGQPMLDMAPALTVGEGEGEGENEDVVVRFGGRRTKDQYEEWNSGRSRRRGKYRMLP